MTDNLGSADAPAAGQTSSMDVRLGLSDPLLSDLKKAGKTIAELQLELGGGPKKRQKLTHKLFFENEKGLDKMLKTFPQIKLKGKGREYEDLSLLLQHYRKWFQELCSVGEHFEDLAWKARQVLQEKEKDDDGHVSDPRELLHQFRLKYKNAAAAASAAASGAHLSDDVRAKIEVNRKLALERKKQKEAQAGNTFATGNPELDMEEIWRMEEEHAAAMKAQSSGPPPGDEDEDIFGFGGGFDDMDEMPVFSQARVSKSVDQAPQVTDDVRARIEANRQQALERKKQKEAQTAKPDAMENHEPLRAQDPQAKAAEPPSMENDETLRAQASQAPSFDPFAEEEDVFGFGGGFDDMDDPGGFGGFDEP